jgi:hypothetical protein
MCLRVKTLIRMTLARMATSPSYKALVARRAYHDRCTQQWRTAIDIAEEEFLLATGIDPLDLETRYPFPAAPWWQPLEISIAADDIDARINHEKRLVLFPNRLRIYTDGSGVDGHVGASAVSLHPRVEHQAYLGTDAQQTVPAAEMVGVIMALRILDEEPAFQGKEVDIFKNMEQRQ